MKKRSYTGFLPAQRLKLSGKEKAVMVGILRDIEAGRIGDDHADPALTGVVSMNVVLVRSSKASVCGRVGCIAGHMAVRLHPDTQVRIEKAFRYFDELSGRSRALSDLTTAGGSGARMSRARAVHVARAMRSFLRTGRPNWRRAMGKKAA